jgi:AraC-like DNA-binding protein
VVDPSFAASNRRLAPFLKRTAVFSGGDLGDTYLRLPNGEIDLVARITDRDVLVHVLGPRTRAVTKPVEEDVVHAVSIRFQPGGAYPFFGVPISALTDRGVSIETLWGRDGTELREALASAPSADAAARVLETALAQRLTSSKVFEPAAATSVRRALRRMRDAETAPRIEGLARELGVSARNLRRVFLDVVGVGPKTFARIVRFQRALRAANAHAEVDWDEIALAAGYYDRSHLITDFRALAGVTPGSLRRSRVGESEPAP